MILVDTSVWIDHLRNGNNVVKALLYNNEVLVHPFIIGELACGLMKNRSEILHLLAELPQAMIADHTEVLKLVESKKLFRAGIGWIDAHLIASALLTKIEMITLDKSLAKAASSLGIRSI
jgi:hypothetical protein